MERIDPFALSAGDFFRRFSGESLTFDDLHVLQPRTIDFGAQEVDLSSRITRNIRINTPLVSSPMEDVSEWQLAVAVALQGFPAIIHYNLSIEEQADQVRRVKRFENGFIKDPITLAPGEKQQLTWEVTSKDAAYRNLILAKIIVLGSLSDPTHKGSCGVMVLKLPGNLSGDQFFWGMFTLAVLMMLGGIWLWWPFGRTYTGRRLEATRSIFGLGFLISIGLIFTAIGLWELAAVSFYISVLMIGVVVPHFLITRG